MQQPTKVLLSSGGMDSYLLACEPELKDAIHLFVDVGQEYAKKEREAATQVAVMCNARFVTVQATNMAVFEHASGIIPFRNAELILCAAQLGEDIYLGVIADEVNSDKSPEFLDCMRHALNISYRAQYWTEGREFRLLTPFREFTKTQLVDRYRLNGGSLSDLLRTVSCYSSSDMHCGKCSSCFKRWVALTNALGEDGTVAQPFESHPGRWKTPEYWCATLKGYPLSRQAEVMDALGLAGFHTRRED